MNNEKLWNMLMNLSMAKTDGLPVVEPNEQTMHMLIQVNRISKRELIAELAQYIPDAYNGLNQDCGNWAKALFDVVVSDCTNHEYNYQD
jgi:hypothetical protein